MTTEKVRVHGKGFDVDLPYSEEWTVFDNGDVVHFAAPNMEPMVYHKPTKHLAKMCVDWSLRSDTEGQTATEALLKDVENVVNSLDDADVQVPTEIHWNGRTYKSEVDNGST